MPSSYAPAVLGWMGAATRLLSSCPHFSADLPTLSSQGILSRILATRSRRAIALRLLKVLVIVELPGVVPRFPATRYLACPDRAAVSQGKHVRQQARRRIVTPNRQHVQQFRPAPGAVNEC